MGEGGPTRIPGKPSEWVGLRSGQDVGQGFKTGDFNLKESVGEY